MTKLECPQVQTDRPQEHTDKSGHLDYRLSDKIKIVTWASGRWK